jgi:CheY-like chemotaxis protein
VTIQKVIKLALSSEGYDILAVSDGKEAIRAIAQERPDVVLIDVALAGADAYTVKRAINADPALASIGFILMASAFERVDEKAAQEVRFRSRLIKPFDPSHLRKAVSDLLAAPQQAPVVTAPIPPPPPSPEPIETAEERSPEPELPSPDSFPQVTLELPPEMPEMQKMADMDATPVVAEATTSTKITSADFPPLMSEEAEEEVAEETATRALENDIKDLTESTIRMSGLDEFQWNLDDSKKMKAPASKSPSTLEVTRPILVGDRKPPPLTSVITPSSKAIDDGGSNFPIHDAQETYSAKIPDAPRIPRSKRPVPVVPPPPGSDLISGRDYVAPTVEISPEPKPKPRESSGAQGQMSRAEIEAMIRKDVESAIERIAREAVPQIAEAIIRKEIEKILAEP